jgi:hypothetical protein
MSMPVEEQTHIKELFKQAILELLQERKEEVYDVFLEVLEEISLTKAIEEGEQTEWVSKAEVFKALEGDD